MTRISACTNQLTLQVIGLIMTFSYTALNGCLIQIKIYINYQLFFRLEGDFAYFYTDIYGNQKTVNPVHELNLIMPLIMAMGSNGCYRQITSDCECLNYGPHYDYDIDYFRYFKLRKDCGHDFIKAISSDPVY